MKNNNKYLTILTFALLVFLLSCLMTAYEMDLSLQIVFLMALAFNFPKEIHFFD